MSNINLGGGYSSSPQASQHWTLRDRLRNLTTALSGNASLDLRFINQYFYKADIGGDPNQYAALELLDATCTRGSKGWYPEWDFTNGGVCGRLTEYANNAIRYGSQGLLEEASSTNQIRNPRCEGAVAGTPGTLPTNWSTSLSAATRTVEEANYRNGVPYTRVRFSGGANNDTEFLILEESTAATAVQGDVLTLSLGLRLAAGSLAGLQRIELRIDEQDINGNFLQSSSILTDAIEGGLDELPRRFFGTYTMLNASAAFARPVIRLVYASSGASAADYTLEVDAPQLEQASAPSSPILPAIGTPGASTRATETVTPLVSVNRASRKSNAGEWDGTNGGAVGAYREYLPNVPAVTGKGLLVEEATTNQIRNPRAEGAVAGTPGTLPTNWDIAAAGTTRSVVGSGYENGWSYVDVRFTGTLSGTLQIRFDTSTAISAVQNDDIAMSVGIRLVGGSAPSSDFGLAISEFNGAASFLARTTLATVSGVSGSHARFAGASSVQEATAATVRPELTYFAASESVDFTLRIYAPQLEQKAYPTSPILPPKDAPGAATRAADVIEVSEGLWSSDGQDFSLFVEYTNPPGELSFPRILEVADAVNERVAIQGLASGASSSYWSGSAGGDTLTYAAAPAAARGDVLRAAISASKDNVRFAITGLPSVLDTSFDVSSIGPRALRVGSSANGTAQPNSYIKSIKFAASAATPEQIDTYVGN
jgi:hypothetical protein